MAHASSVTWSLFSTSESSVNSSSALFHTAVCIYLSISCHHPLLPPSFQSIKSSSSPFFSLSPCFPSPPHFCLCSPSAAVRRHDVRYKVQDLRGGAQGAHVQAPISSPRDPPPPERTQSKLTENDVPTARYILQLPTCCTIQVETCTRARDVQASAAKLLKETCNYIKSLHREIDDLSDRLSELIATMDMNSAEAEIVRSLLHS